ncbi:hypothetical protein TEA_001784 [Camellia sinensis var. sinensis]|uniref:Oxidoreductase N-terminal domain-containing protein n=1 Tax=Camellia sinensis var. sinensis TaxID=542762 RepID=A0A4S4DZN4_CAMSN|nr:hypothetical protein TEA_001784 [Camellia sinensis var. sinensis]
MEVMNKFITIKRHIEGAPQESDFELKTESISLSVQAGSNDVIVKTFYLSIDPYQLNRMKSYSSSQKAHSFAVGIIPGEAIDAFGLGRVVASGHPGFEKDDLVAGVITWGEYSLIKGAVMLNKLDTMGLPLSYHVGILVKGRNTWILILEERTIMKKHRRSTSRQTMSLGAETGTRKVVEMSTTMKAISKYGRIESSSNLDLTLFFTIDLFFFSLVLGSVGRERKENVELADIMERRVLEDGQLIKSHHPTEVIAFVVGQIELFLVLVLNIGLPLHICLLIGLFKLGLFGGKSRLQPSLGFYYLNLCSLGLGLHHLSNNLNSLGFGLCLVLDSLGCIGLFHQALDLCLGLIE